MTKFPFYSLPSLYFTYSDSYKQSLFPIETFSFLRGKNKKKEGVKSPFWDVNPFSSPLKHLSSVESELVTQAAKGEGKHLKESFTRVSFILA